MKYICPSCGFEYQEPCFKNFNDLDKPPSWFVVCPCCGFDLSVKSYNDMRAIREAREYWYYYNYIERRWRNNKPWPANWNAIDQLNKIPEKFDREHAFKLFNLNSLDDETCPSSP